MVNVRNKKIKLRNKEVRAMHENVALNCCYADEQPYSVCKNLFKVNNNDAN